MRFFSCAVITFFLISCSSNEQDNTAITDTIPSQEETIDPISEAVDSTTGQPYSYSVFETPGLGWGYQIFENDVLFINQPHIPAIQGNKGFSTKEKAEITAIFAVHKMEQGFVPPTLSPEELDSLGVLD
jgi:Domain of unknown function (DUF4907)